MAVITATALANGVITPTVTTLGATDTLPVSTGRQTLFLTNGTGGALTAVIDGDGATTVTVDGLGAPVSVSSGFSVSLPAGATRIVRLSTIRLYLAGTVTVTGATGATAILLNG